MLRGTGRLRPQGPPRQRDLDVRELTDRDEETRRLFIGNLWIVYTSLLSGPNRWHICGLAVTSMLGTIVAVSSEQWVMPL